MIIGRQLDVLALTEYYDATGGNVRVSCGISKKLSTFIFDGNRSTRNIRAGSPFAGNNVGFCSGSNRVAYKKHYCTNYTVGLYIVVHEERVKGNSGNTIS